MDTLTTILHHYRFDISYTDQEKEYKKLCNDLRNMGLKVFASISDRERNWYKKYIKPLDGQQIALELTHLFHNQWNTGPTNASENGLRIFDWAEEIYPNRDIREGQWIEQTPEMAEVRRNTVKCGYCGKQYQAAQGYIFCEACLDSEYLKESELHLLRLLPVSAGFSAKRLPLSEREREWILPEYIKRQTTGADRRNAIEMIRRRDRVERDYRAAIIKHDGFLWLLDNGVSIDNCIFYDHTGRFCFGWQSPMSEGVKSALLDKLVEFPFDYDIKSEGGKV